MRMRRVRWGVAGTAWVVGVERWASWGAAAGARRRKARWKGEERMVWLCWGVRRLGWRLGPIAAELELGREYSQVRAVGLREPGAPLGNRRVFAQ